MSIIFVKRGEKLFSEIMLEIFFYIISYSKILRCGRENYFVKENYHGSVCVYVCTCLVVSDSLVTPWTVACLAALSMRFLRQEYWSRLPFPPPGAFPDPRIEPSNLHLVTLLNSFISSRSVVLFCSEIP